MPKRTTDFNVPINVLIREDGTKEALIAIAMLRGEGSSFAGPVRDALGSYVRQYVAGLSPAERKRYEEILASTKLNTSLQRQIREEGKSVKIHKRSRSLNS